MEILSGLGLLAIGVIVFVWGMSVARTGGDTPAARFLRSDAAALSMTVLIAFGLTFSIDALVHAGA